MAMSTAKIISKRFIREPIEERSPKVGPEVYPEQPQRGGLKFGMVIACYG